MDYAKIFFDTFDKPRLGPAHPISHPLPGNNRSYLFSRRTLCRSWGSGEARSSATLPRQGATPARPTPRPPPADTGTCAPSFRGPGTVRPAARSSYTPRCYCPPCTYKQPITELQLHPTMFLSAMYLQTTNHRAPVTLHNVTVRHVPTNNHLQSYSYTPRCTYKQPITMLLSVMYLQTTNHRTLVTPHDVTVRHVPTNNQSQSYSYTPRCYCPPCTYKQPITEL